MSSPEGSVTVCAWQTHCTRELETEEWIAMNLQKVVFYPKTPLRIPPNLCEKQSWALCHHAPPLPRDTAINRWAESRCNSLLPHLESYEWILCENRMAGKKKIQGTNIYWVPVRCQAMLGAEVTKVLNEIWIPALKDLAGCQDRPSCAHILTIHCEED